MSSNVIDDIRGNFHGQVVLPGEGEYDEARSVFNAMINKRPAAVIRVADESHVIEGVKLARDHGFELAIRGHVWWVPRLAAPGR